MPNPVPVPQLKNERFHQAGILVLGGVLGGQVLGAVEDKVLEPGERNTAPSSFAKGRGPGLQPRGVCKGTRRLEAPWRKDTKKGSLCRFVLS